jgi:hypothetical protein
MSSEEISDQGSAEATPNDSNPLKVIAAATKAVPFVKYALGLSGLLALISLVKAAFGLSFRVAVWGTIIILVLMTILFLLAKASQIESLVKGPATVLLWAIVVVFVLTIACLFASVFFKFPLDLCKWIDPDCVKKNTALTLKSDSTKHGLDVDSLVNRHKGNTLPDDGNLKRRRNMLTISIQLKSETEGYKRVYYDGAEVNPLPESTTFNPRIEIKRPGGKLMILTRRGDTCNSFIPETLDSSITRINPNCNLE